MEAMQKLFEVIKEAQEDDKRDSFTTLVSFQQQSTLQCSNCRKKFPKLDPPDTILRLAFPPVNHNPVLLSDLLDFHTKKEKLEDQVPHNCPSTELFKATKEISIANTGGILTIQLKRYEIAYGENGKPIFDENGTLIKTKIKTKVQYPVTGLQLGNDTFDLSAVINHDGSASSGHYRAFIKRENCWYDCNDGEITPLQNMSLAGPRHDVPKIAIQSEEAYMLMYTKRDSTMNVDNDRPAVVLTHKDVLPESVRTSTVDMDCEIGWQDTDMDAAIAASLLPSSSPIKNASSTPFADCMKQHVMDGRDHYVDVEVHGKPGHLTESNELELALQATRAVADLKTGAATTVQRPREKEVSWVRVRVRVRVRVKVRVRVRIKGEC